MKTLIIYLTVALWAGVINAQEVIQLNETKVHYDPILDQAKTNNNSFTYTVKRSYSDDFEKDPLAFMKDNFDVPGFLHKVQDLKYDSYQVSFRSKKGVLMADFDKKGNLLKSSQTFEDVALPENLRKELAEEYKGWGVEKIVQKARGTGGENSISFYKIKLKKGNEKMNLKIDATTVSGVEVALK